MIEELTLRTEMFDLTDDVTVDIKRLLNSIGQDAYFKVDVIAERFGKEIRHFFTKNLSKDRHEYRKALIEESTDKKFTYESLRKFSTPAESHKIDIVKSKDKNVLELLDDSYASTFSKEKRNYYVYNVRYNRYDLDYLAYRLDGRGK